ncbi:hypothetical protein RclHR1_11720004 [Rhizophagus clarus]|uniref:Protein kinase domain-containing protein n=1 Tax=Rhizophagus clarus TaxID=94130 RepID=A0A2Z6Q9I6_9GLOM|nr:hypothetical protein RclHR1_11720004 [Rhizophagus clarus]
MSHCYIIISPYLFRVEPYLLYEKERYYNNEISYNYGISQNPVTKNYILVFNNIYFDYYCKKCGNKSESSKWCKPCQINYINRTGGNEKIDIFIQKMQLKVKLYLDKLNKIIFGISQDQDTKIYILVFNFQYYCEKCNRNRKSKNCVLCQQNENKKIVDQFSIIEEIGKGGFSTVYSAIWKDGLLEYIAEKSYAKYKVYNWSRKKNTRVALKCLHDLQNSLDEYINEAFPKQKIENIVKIYGISQNPDTKDYLMVLEYAECGNFNNYLNKNYENFDWLNGSKVLTHIIEGLGEIHQKQMVHRDFHIGNILFMNDEYKACISDMGLCKKLDDIDKTSIGVMPYIAPEVLRGRPYTQAADIYSFEVLALNIYNGIRPEINDKIAPKCYIDLMKKCWDSNSDNSPNSIELFHNSLG